jgi:hypothetical protein
MTGKIRLGNAYHVAVPTFHFPFSVFLSTSGHRTPIVSGSLFAAR